MYIHLYPQLSESDFSIPLSIRKYSSVTAPLFRYDSNGKGSNVLANWTDQAQIITNIQDQTPGKVQYYFTHSILLDSVLTQHLIAYVTWYEPHPNRNKLGKPLEIWYKDMYQTRGHPALYLFRVYRTNSFFMLLMTQIK